MWSSTSLFHNVLIRSLSFSPVAVQTNIIPPKKVQAGGVQSSLVQASVAAIQNPMGCDTTVNGHCLLPRLSITSRSASVVTGIDSGADGSPPHTVMKWKTVLAVFVVVVVYLVCGGLAFRALEQPFESNQKDNITQEKASFLQRNPCVSPEELEDLIKVSFLSYHNGPKITTTSIFQIQIIF